MIEVALANCQETHPIDAEQLCAAVERVLGGEGFAVGSVSLAIVDDAEMHELNRRHLAHDYPTDVLSFVFERCDDSVEGEVIASADYAAAMAPRAGWRPGDELLLYVIHGTLHLAGYDDTTDEAAATMRERERHYLRQFGLERRELAG